MMTLIMELMRGLCSAALQPAALSDADSLDIFKGPRRVWPCQRLLSAMLCKKEKLPGGQAYSML